MKKILFILTLLISLVFGQVTFVNDSTAIQTGGTSLTITCSAFTLTGDLLVALIAKDDDPTFDDESGWTSITKGVATTGDLQAYVSVCYILSPSDGEQAFTWDNGDSEYWYGMIATFRGNDTSTPIHGTPYQWSGDTQYPTINGSGYSSLTTGSIAVAAMGNDRERTITNDDADFPNDIELQGAGGSGGVTLGMSYTNAISGDGTAPACQFTLSVAEEWRGGNFIIEAATAGADWTGTFMGVTDPSKVFDQDVSGISKVMGVE